MSPDLQFFIEAACLVGLMLLAAFSNRVLATQLLTRSTWLRLGGLLIASLFCLYFMGRGQTMFAIIVGGCGFAAGLVVLMLVFTAGWKLVRGRAGKPFDRQAAINFAGAGLFGLMATACLTFGVLSFFEVQRVSAEEKQYENAPTCSTTVTDSCLLHAQGVVVGKWAERSSGPHWVEVRVADRTQDIKVETALNVWSTLVAGQLVELTSWKGRVTDVTAPRVGTMLTGDSPQFLAFLGPVFVGVSAFAFVLFLAGGFTFGLKGWAAMKGVDPETLGLSAAPRSGSS
jgi:hypothetical protein